MNKAVIDQDKSEATAEITFVCPSRAKRQVDFFIEPMPFERRSKVGEKTAFQLRLIREEVRLRTLAEETLGLHGGWA